MAETTRARESDLRANQYWTGYLAYVLQNNEPVLTFSGLPGRLKTVSVKSVQATARQYLDGSNRVEIVQLPKQ